VLALGGSEDPTSLRRSCIDQTASSTAPLRTGPSATGDVIPFQPGAFQFWLGRPGIYGPVDITEFVHNFSPRLQGIDARELVTDSGRFLRPARLPILGWSVNRRLEAFGPIMDQAAAEFFDRKPVRHGPDLFAGVRKDYWLGVCALLPKHHAGLLRAARRRGQQARAALTEGKDRPDPQRVISAFGCCAIAQSALIRR
jgi:hypothetical protein